LSLFYKNILVEKPPIVNLQSIVKQEHLENNPILFYLRTPCKMPVFI